jgi:hypothetical protein
VSFPLNGILLQQPGRGRPPATRSMSFPGVLERRAEPPARRAPPCNVNRRSRWRRGATHASMNAGGTTVSTRSSPSPHFLSGPPPCRRPAQPSCINCSRCSALRFSSERGARQDLGRRRRIFQFLPFNFAEIRSRRLPCCRNINPSPTADPLCAGSLVRVNKVSIVLVADVGPDVVR